MLTTLSVEVGGFSSLSRILDDRVSVNNRRRRSRCYRGLTLIRQQRNEPPPGRLKDAPPLHTLNRGARKTNGGPVIIQQQVCLCWLPGGERIRALYGNRLVLFSLKKRPALTDLKLDRCLLIWLGVQVQRPPGPSPEIGLRGADGATGGRRLAAGAHITR